MNAGPFWKALGVQAAAVAVLFGTLLALPLPDGFFDDWGFLVGPLAWLACSVLTARTLALPPALALFAAVSGGVAGAIVLLVVGHGSGMVVGLLVFAAWCASYVRRGEQTATTE